MQLNWVQSPVLPRKKRKEKGRKEGREGGRKGEREEEGEWYSIHICIIIGSDFFGLKVREIHLRLFFSAFCLVLF
jgi:hypothetical protein